MKIKVINFFFIWILISVGFFNCINSRISHSTSDNIFRKTDINEIKFRDFVLVLRLVIGNSNKSNTFDYPSAIASDGRQFIYIADKKRNLINIFTHNGEFIKTVGKEGNRKGEFSSPIDIQVDNDNCLYVSDSRNKRIQILSLEGKFINLFKVQFYPGQIIQTDKFLYVSPYSLGKYPLYKYSKKNGKLLSLLGRKSRGTLGDEQIQNQANLAIDKKYIYLAYRFLPKVMIFTSEGNLINQFEYNPIIKNRQKPFVKRITEKKRISAYEVYMKGEVRKYPICYDMAIDIYGFLYLLIAADHAKDEICAIYRFSASGDLLDRVDIPFHSGKIYIDSSNNFYFISPGITKLLYIFFKVPI